MYLSIYKLIQMTKALNKIIKTHTKINMKKKIKTNDNDYNNVIMITKIEMN